MNQKLLRFFKIFSLVFISISLGTIGLFFLVAGECFFWGLVASLVIIFIAFDYFIFGDDNLKARAFLASGLFTIAVWILIMIQVAEAFV